MMEKLWINVERECGKYRVRLHRAKISLARDKEKRPGVFLKTFCKFLIYALIASVLIMLVIIFFFNQKISTATVTLVSTFTGTLASFMALIPALSVVIQEVRRSRGKWILNEVKNFEKFDRSDFSEETGFMGKVKDEVEYLFDFLTTELIVDDEINRNIQLRLLVFIDDLDRCSTPDTIMKVLQAVSLLLVDAPITCYLAIDSRRIVTSVERHFGGQFATAGLNGYEYLEKIVQVPFCLPNLDKDQKEIFIMKELQNSTLNALTIYKRLKFLAGKGFDGITDVFEEPKAIPINEKGAIDALRPTFKKMIDSEIFLHATEAGGNIFSLIGEMSPEEVDRALDFSSSLREHERVTDQFLYFLSTGIEILRTSHHPGDVEPDKTTMIGPSDIDVPDIPHGTADYSPRPSDFRPPVVEVPPVVEEEEYMSLFPSLATSEELKWFSEYSEYFIGRPRKIKRIINCYMLSRYVANALRSDNNSIHLVATTSIFYHKLLKLIILLEQWPYRMAWLLLVVENIQQEFEMKANEPNTTSERLNIGDTFISLIAKTFGSSKSHSMEGCEDLALFDIYDHFVQVLMHSSPDSVEQLQRDGDPQVFEQMLLHGDAALTLKLKDISTPEKKGGSSQDTLRRYVFNLQTHTIEKVALEVENCLLVFNHEETERTMDASTTTNGANESMLFRHAKFERKSSYFNSSTVV